MLKNRMVLNICLSTIFILLFSACSAKNDIKLCQEYFSKGQYALALASCENSKNESSNSLNTIGWLYQNGLGVPKDYVKAKQYYQQAIDKDNNSTALNNLAMLYVNGLGVPKD